MSRRVVVTGMGVVSAIGIGKDAYWRSLQNGTGGIGACTALWTRDERGDAFKPSVAEVSGFDASPLGVEVTRMDRFTQMAVMAADEALADSRLVTANEDARRFAAIIGSGIGGHETQDEAYYGMLRRGKRVHPLTVLRTISSTAPSLLSIRYGLRGPAFAIASACASGAHAIGVCADLIRSGAADMGLAGAAEACLTYGCLMAWNAMRATATRCSSHLPRRNSAEHQARARHRHGRMVPGTWHSPCMTANKAYIERTPTIVCRSLPRDADAIQFQASWILRMFINEVHTASGPRRRSSHPGRREDSRRHHHSGHGQGKAVGR